MYMHISLLTVYPSISLYPSPSRPLSLSPCISCSPRRKGANITIKKIDAVSGNLLPNEPALNFPDFDIAGLLAAASSDNKSTAAYSEISTLEIGRKLSSSSATGAFALGSDFRSSLQGSDFASVAPDSDFSHHPDIEADFGDPAKFPLKPATNVDRHFEFQVPPPDSRKRKSISLRRHLLLDKVDELMLGKDQLFITESEMFRNDDDNLSFANGTPSQLNLPWSSSSASKSNSSNSSRRTSLTSFIDNTPIRKGSSTATLSTPSPLTEPFADLKLISATHNSQTLSDESFDFFYFLQEKLSSLADKSGRSASNTFKRIISVDVNGRAVAARAFHHLLELRTANLVDLKQASSFSDIKISLI
jgi:hypothetical protein